MKSITTLIAHTNPKSPISEAYRTLRTNIQFSNLDGNLNTIILTSAGPEEGKSTTLANLAVSIAQSDKKVLVIDADMRKSMIHKIFGIQNIKGLTNALVEGINYKAVVNYVNHKNLEILTSGPKPPNPSELLGSKKMQGLIEIVKNDYDIVLMDAPPVLPVADASILGSYVDGVILVVRYGQVTFEAAASAKEQLNKVNAKLLGVVLNDIPMNHKGYNYYYYYYLDESPEEINLKNKNRYNGNYAMKKRRNQGKRGSI